MKKRLVILAALLIAAFCFNAQPASAASSGKCGANATWKLSGDTLTISGIGAMDNYTVEGGELTNSTIPWASDMMKIKKVVIGEGITHLGEFAFFKATNLKSVSLPSTLVEIGATGFSMTKNWNPFSCLRNCNTSALTPLIVPASKSSAWARP